MEGYKRSIVFHGEMYKESDCLSRETVLKSEIRAPSNNLVKLAYTFNYTKSHYYHTYMERFIWIICPVIKIKEMMLCLRWVELS